MQGQPSALNISKNWSKPFPAALSSDVLLWKINLCPFSKGNAQQGPITNNCYRHRSLLTERQRRGSGKAAKLLV